MKKYLLIPALCATLFFSCRSKKEVNSSVAATTTQAATPAGNTTGTVSYKYRATGCSTVIIVKQEEGEELTLIPKDKIAKEFDVDGMMIIFNYHTLRMPQPQGCTTGIPAEITDVSKK
jgi:hypothetical protein